MSQIHVLPRRAEATVRLHRNRLGTTAHKSGAKSWILLPSSQGSSQKRIELPSSTRQETEPLKNIVVITSSTTGTEAQGRDGSVHWSHSQRTRRASPKRLWSLTPRPPAQVAFVLAPRQLSICLFAPYSCPSIKRPS
jgi:hypothetical protein